MTTRKSLITMVHIAKARMGMDEETYRVWLEKKTGKRSSSALSDGQLGQLVKALRAEGLLDEPPAAAKVIAGKGANRPTDAQWKTARSLVKKIGPTRRRPRRRGVRSLREADHQAGQARVSSPRPAWRMC